MSRQPKPSPEFGATISRYMEARGLSQRALATLVGVYPSDVGRWRQGSGISHVNVVRLSEALGIDLDALERLAGYGASDSRDDASTDLHPAVEAEAEVYRAWYSQLLEKKVPRSMWKAYTEACDALAAAFGEAAGAATNTPAGADANAVVAQNGEGDEQPDSERVTGLYHAAGTRLQSASVAVQDRPPAPIGFGLRRRTLATAAR